MRVHLARGHDSCIANRSVFLQTVRGIGCVVPRFEILCPTMIAARGVHEWIALRNRMTSLVALVELIGIRNVFNFLFILFKLFIFSQYSDATVIEQPDKHDVLQTLTYAFNGSDPKFPKGTLTLRLFFENTNKSIFAPDGVYTACIISGSDTYLNATGTVAINIKNDERNATIHFTHI